MEGRFNGVFFALPSYSLLALPVWGLIFGGAYFRNFTVLHKEMSLKKSLKKRFDMNIQKKVTSYDSKEESRLACSIQAPRWMEPITDNLN